MSQWVKCTMRRNSEPIWINLDLVRNIKEVPEQGGTAIRFDVGEGHGLVVTEAADDIIRQLEERQRARLG